MIKYGGDMRKQLLIPTLYKVASKMGLEMIIEPTRAMYGVIMFKNGKKFYIKDVNFNINNATSASLAKNKAATSFFLKQFGYNVPEFTMVYDDDKCSRINSRDSIVEGLDFARLIGFPIIVKPNNMSQGRYVYKLQTEEEYLHSMEFILKACDTVLVQKFYPGNDYRVVVLGEKIISAYQRVPFYVIGDGCCSISALMEKKQQLFQSAGRDTKIDIDDPRITTKLQHQSYSLSSIPPCGDRVFLQDISNLSAGGETVELTDRIHNSFASLALMLAKDMNLALCGIDIITTDITEVNDDNYIVIEVNSAPGLDNYAHEGSAQDIYVESLYEEVLDYIAMKYS